MEILHTVTSMDIKCGGPTESLKLLVNGLNNSGTNAKILTFDFSGVNDALSENKYIRRIKRPIEVRFGYSIAFKKSLDFYKNFDIFHAHGLWQYPSHVTNKFSKKNNIPFVLSPHGMLYPEALKVSRFIKKISLAFYQLNDIKNVSVLHATCLQELHHIRSLGIRIPIAVIPNPVEISTTIIEKYFTRRKKIGFIGRFTTIKNIENLINAWSLISKDNLDWDLVLIGDGDSNYKRSLINQVENLKLKNVLFPGFLLDDAKEEMFKSLSYIVLPSKSENFGMVVAEALVRGIPVIASKGTPWEELNTSHSGWWIELGVDPLVDALKQAMNITETERLQMGLNGRKLIEEKYSIASVTDKMISLYSWILEGGQKPEFVSL